MRLQSMLGAAAAALAVLAFVTESPAAGQEPTGPRITFEPEVRTILRAHCAPCHAAGGPAPMPLTTYDEVRPWARAIKDQVLTRRMPKWSAAHGYGAFANDPSLSQVELAAIAAWVDAGQPKGSTGSAANANPRTHALLPNAARLKVPAGKDDAVVQFASRWIGGWDFDPGDSLITAARFTSENGAAIATWVAGDPPVRLPADTGMQVTPPIRIHLTRRRPAASEAAATPKPSVLRLLPRAAPPRRRAQPELWSCGMPWTGRPGDLLAITPDIDNGASIRVWLERPGAPRTIVGWFRDNDRLYPRAYWFARPPALPVESVIAADASCSVWLLVSAPR